MVVLAFFPAEERATRWWCGRDEVWDSRVVHEVGLKRLGILQHRNKR